MTEREKHFQINVKLHWSDLLFFSFSAFLKYSFLHIRNNILLLFFSLKKKKSFTKFQATKDRSDTETVHLIMSTPCHLLTTGQPTHLQIFNTCLFSIVFKVYIQLTLERYGVHLLKVGYKYISKE